MTNPYRGLRCRRSDDLATRLAFYGRPQPNGCVLWSGSGKAGYGKLRWRGQMRYAHILAWELHHGPVPEGLEVRHRCDVPACIAVAHLELGTHAENIRDSFERGRASRRDGEANNAARLTLAYVDAVRRKRSEGWKVPALALWFGISKSQVYNIIRNKQWKGQPT